MRPMAKPAPRTRSSAKKQPVSAALPENLAFMRLLWAVDHGLRSLSKQMQATIGLTGPQRLVLRILGRTPRVMPSELAELLHLDRGTVSGVLDRLVDQQLIVRRPHPEDGRSVLVELSARGKLLDREAAGTVESCVRRALGSVPRSKVDAAIAVLEALAGELTREEQRGLARRAEGSTDE
jgi:MarR family transcriptional regulator, organic hydroperoxide resistance regulator